MDNLCHSRMAHKKRKILKYCQPVQQHSSLRQHTTTLSLCCSGQLVVAERNRNVTCCLATPRLHGFPSSASAASRGCYVSEMASSRAKILYGLNLSGGRRYACICPVFPVPFWCHTQIWNPWTCFLLDRLSEFPLCLLRERIIITPTFITIFLLQIRSWM